MHKTKSILLQRGSTVFLRLALFALGAAVLALCIFALPSLWVHVPDEYPDYSYVFYAILSAFYVGAVPFFIAIQKALKLLAYIDKRKAFSLLSVRALRHISYCGVAIALIFMAVSPFFYIWAQNDDAPGLIVMNMILVGASLTVTVFSAVVGQLLKEAIAIKNENELTV